MIDTFLVPEKTVVTEKGEGPAVALSGSAGRVFLLNLVITDIVEQQSLDVSILTSADGTTWDAKPVASFPQKFYRGEHPLLLDLTDHAATTVLRAHWDVARWGRGSETPRFEFHVFMREVPSDVLKGARAEAQALG